MERLLLNKVFTKGAWPYTALGNRQNNILARDNAISADRTYPKRLTTASTKLASKLLADLGPSQLLGSMIRIASVCLAAYWIAIFVATHLPQSALPNLHWSDKAYHAIAFSGLSFLLAWAIPIHSWKGHLASVAAIALTYACLDEYTQQFIPGRACELLDIAADAVGICIGLCTYVVFRQVLIAMVWGRRLIQKLSR